MDIKVALKLFDIESYGKINQDELKKKWRQLILKAHPDKGGSPEEALKINSAYEILKNSASKLLELSNNGCEGAIERYIITINELVDIFDGKTIRVLDSSGYRKYSNIGISEINTKKIIVEIPLTVTFRGVSSQYEEITVRGTKDNYDVSILIHDPDIKDKVSIAISIGAKTIKGEMADRKMRFLINMTHNVYVNVLIERVELNG